MNEFTKAKVERFLNGKVYQELSRNGRPAWSVQGLGCFYLNDKNKIKPTNMRMLIQSGYYFKSEKGVTRGWKATEKPKKAKEEKEIQDMEEEAKNYVYWVMGKRINNYHGPTRATMLLGSIK